MNTYAVVLQPILGGRTKRDVIRADSRRDVRNKARKDGYIVAECTRTDPTGDKINVRHGELKVEFYNEWALYVKNAAPAPDIAEGLRATFEGANNKFRSKLTPVLDQLGANALAYKAIEAQPYIFGSDEVTLVELGFQRGRRVETLEMLAKHIGRQSDVDGKVSRALVYPKILSAAALIVGGIYVSFVLPQLRAFYKDLNIDPVFPLNFIIWLVDSIGHPLPAAICTLSILALTALTFALPRISKQIAYRLDHLMLHMIIFGKLRVLQQRLAVLFAIDLMVQNGEEVRALEAARSVAKGAVFRAELDSAIEALRTRSVKSWTDALSHAPTVFDAVVAGSLRNAHRYGELKTKIPAVVEMTEKKALQAVETLPRKLESVLSVVFTVVIGLLVYAMLIPATYATSQIH